MSAKTKRIFKKTLFSILPIIVIVKLGMYILKKSGYEPDGSHSNLSHISDAIVIFGAYVVIVYLILSLLVIWFSKRLRWYGYIPNILLIFALGIMAKDKFDSYSRAKQHDEKERRDTLTNKKIDKIWELIENKKEPIIEVDNLGKKNYSSDINIRISGLNLALYVESPTKFKEYKDKSIMIYSNKCPVFKELLRHIETIDEKIYLELLTELKEEKDRLHSCLPIYKADFIIKLIEEDKLKAVEMVLTYEIHGSNVIVEILPQLKKIEDDKLRFKLISTLLRNYEYQGKFYSFGKEMKALFESASIYEALQGTKAFNTYIDILQIQLIKKRKESFSQNNSIKRIRESKTFSVDEDLKRDFLRMKKVLDANSSLMQEIPLYIKKHFEEEALKDKKADEYLLYSKKLTYKDNRGYERSYGDASYSLYVDGKKVQTSLSGYYGNVRYRCNTEDIGKKVLIEYDHNRTLEDRLTGKYEKRDSEYWIIDNGVNR